jgi:hypothetical protein
VAQSEGGERGGVLDVSVAADRINMISNQSWQAISIFEAVSRDSV